MNDDDTDVDEEEYMKMKMKASRFSNVAIFNEMDIDGSSTRSVFTVSRPFSQYIEQALSSPARSSSCLSLCKSISLRSYLSVRLTAFVPAFLSVVSSMQRSVSLCVRSYVCASL